MKKLSIILIVILQPATTGSKDEPSAAESGKSYESLLGIYTTAYLFAYFTEHIRGERINTIHLSFWSKWAYV